MTECANSFEMKYLKQLKNENLSKNYENFSKCQVNYTVHKKCVNCRITNNSRNNNFNSSDDNEKQQINSKTNVISGLRFCISSQKIVSYFPSFVCSLSLCSTMCVCVCAFKSNRIDIALTIILRIVGIYVEHDVKQRHNISELKWILYFYLGFFFVKIWIATRNCELEYGSVHTCDKFSTIHSGYTREKAARIKCSLTLGNYNYVGCFSKFKHTSSFRHQIENISSCTVGRNTFHSEKQKKNTHTHHSPLFRPPCRPSHRYPFSCFSDEQKNSTLPTKT